MSILKFFKKETPARLETRQIVKELKSKSQKEIVEEIHETFYTEVHRLLEEAKISRSLETTKTDLLEKRVRLLDAGFYNTAEVKEATQELERIENLRLENEKNKDITEAIHYFSQKYPLYKFITEDSVKKICKKYGLIYSSVGKYIGTVPDKNLKQIEEFKIRDEDACYEKIKVYGFSEMTDPSIVSFDEFQKYENASEDEKLTRILSPVSTHFRRCPLEIAAPMKEFKLDSRERVENYTIIVEEDPIVLQPVYFKGVKHYLVVTAWGAEAGDELVVNHINN